MKIKILLITACLVLSTLPARAASLNKLLKDFDKTVQETMTTWGVPALAIAIVKNGEVVYQKAVGVKNLETGEKVDTRTVFQIASLSKTFTSTLAGILKDEGKISFNDPVIKYVPNLVLGTEEQTQKITLKHILSHSTGFPSYAGDPRVEGGESFDSILQSFQKLKVLYEPGLVHGYQNVIYSLAGKSIELRMKTDFEKLLHDKIFEPLGMQNASVGKENLLNAPNKASPYIYHVHKHEHVPISYSTKYYEVTPAAGINASIEDMTKWLLFQMGYSEPIMNPNTIRELQSPIIKSPDETRRMSIYPGRVTQSHYGLGWRIYDYSGYTMINHSGMLNGFKSMLAFLPDENFGVVILGNTTGKALGILRTSLFDAYLDLPKVDWNKQFKDEELKAEQLLAKRQKYRPRRKSRR